VSGLNDRHLVGAGAAACAVCCAPPIIGLLGLAGAAATAVTFAFMGAVFAAVVGLGTLAALARRRYAARRARTCTVPAGPVDLTLSTERAPRAEGWLP